MLLPWKRKTIGGITLSLREYEGKYFSEALALFQKSIKDSKGMGEGEFNDSKSFEKYIEQSELVYTVHNADKYDKIIGCGMIYGSPLARSNVPLYGSAYFVMDADYREKGIFSELTTSMKDLGMEMTYPAACGRNALTAVTALMNVKRGVPMTGTIPKSVNVAKVGWLPDMIPVAHFPVNEERFLQKVMSQNRLSKDAGH